MLLSKTCSSITVIGNMFLKAITFLTSCIFLFLMLSSSGCSFLPKAEVRNDAIYDRSENLKRLVFQIGGDIERHPGFEPKLREELYLAFNKKGIKFRNLYSNNLEASEPDDSHMLLFEYMSQRGGIHLGAYYYSFYIRRNEDNALILKADLVLPKSEKNGVYLSPGNAAKKATGLIIEFLERTDFIDSSGP